MEQINFVDLKKQFSSIEREITDSVLEVLRSGQYILGPIVEEIEKKLSLYSNVNNVITVSSGTDALFVSLHALGIGPGSKVFIPSFTYTATAEVIALVVIGAKLPTRLLPIAPPNDCAASDIRWIL